MSTKTITKRVALATVVALGAGVLSLVSVTSASALGTNTAAGATNPIIAAGGGTLYVASASSTTGSGIALATADNSSLVGGSAPAASAAASVGLINVSDQLGSSASAPVAGTTQTATLLSSGALSLYVNTSASVSAAEYSTIVVTGGTISSSTGSYLNSTATIAYSTAAATHTTVWGAVVKPASGATSFTVAYYNGEASTTAAAAASGTLVGFLTVTVASTSVAGTVSTSKSGAYFSSDGSVSNGTRNLLTADDTALASSYAWNAPQFLNVRILDAFGTPLTSTSGLLQVTATNGVNVAIGSGVNSAAPATNGTVSTAFTTGTTPDNYMFRLSAPSTAAVSTTVTVTYGGVVIATRTTSWTGQVAKVTLSSPTTGSIVGGGTTGTATIAFADAAGNAIYPTSSSTAYPQAYLATDGSTLNAIVTAGSIAYSDKWPTSSRSGTWQFTCGGATAGSANVAVKYTNPDGSVIQSNALKVTCADKPYSYTAKLDKASYAPGDIATLTVTFLDSKGNVANDIAAGIAPASGTTNIPTISGGYLAGTNGSTTTAGSAGDATTNGVATYKLIVGAPTTDPYSGQIIVSFPTVNAVNAAQSAVTVGYSIKSGSTSLNDVLKGIVSLIASINKQIAALAKLVTKK